jgi:hypothetical protein
MLNKTDSAKLNLSVSTANADVYNSTGVHINDIEDAYEIVIFDNQLHTDITYSLPHDTYRIVPKDGVNPAMPPAADEDASGDGDAEPFTVRLSDDQTYISASNANPFETAITLGDSPRFDIEDGLDSFDMSITTTNAGFNANDITVHTRGEDSFTVVFSKDVPVLGSLGSVSFTAETVTADEYGGKTLKFNFDTDAELEEDTDEAALKREYIAARALFDAAYGKNRPDATVTDDMPTGAEYYLAQDYYHFFEVISAIKIYVIDSADPEGFATFAQWREGLEKEKNIFIASKKTGTGGDFTEDLGQTLTAELNRAKAAIATAQSAGSVYPDGTPASGVAAGVKYWEESDTAFLQAPIDGVEGAVLPQIFGWTENDFPQWTLILSKFTDWFETLMYKTGTRP